MRNISLSSDNFNHCSSVSYVGEGYCVAYYAGRTECHQSQSVYLSYVKNGHLVDTIKIGDNTGNPVIWCEQDTVVLLYSKFEDDGPIDRLSDRWKYCSLWLQSFGFVNNKIYWLTIPINLSTQRHLLGRCKPIVHRNNLLLPLYDELNRNCVLYGGRNLSYISTYGVDMIQPTIWKSNDILNSLGRNFHSDHKVARHHSSPDGITWGDENMTNIPNINNSICVTSCDKGQIIVYNKINTHHRRDLRLGVLTNDFTIVNDKSLNLHYGSYPSADIRDGKAIISYTTGEGKISVTEYDIDSIFTENDSE